MLITISKASIIYKGLNIYLITQASIKLGNLRDLLLIISNRNNFPYVLIK